MTISCSSKLLLSLVLIYHILITTSTSYAIPSNNASTVLIQTVCSKAQNPTICNRVLSSDPRSARADIKGLAQISIDKAFAGGNQVFAVIASLYKRAADHETKSQLQSCTGIYKNAMTNLNMINDALKIGDKKIYGYVISVIDDAESCEDVYEGPPVIPPILEKANKNFEDIAYIIYAIVTLL